MIRNYRSVHILLLICIILAEGDTFKPESKILVTTGLGKIRGSTLTSRLGPDFYAFRGIRYAQPPIEELRFKAPEPIEHWTGEFDATEDGPMCPQPTRNQSDVSEDCLRLNVYTHNIPNTINSGNKKPVIVYLHPGGFYAFSGQSKNYAGPELLMDRDIVLVTVNYRLGSLGFMSTGTKDAPGNAGLKDQVMALKWVKLHISHFGGDPNSVTLMGYSAGALSSTLHLISPMSKGLFHKVIIMSAAATSQVKIVPSQIDLAKRQARVLNCTDTSIREMIKCLKTRDAVDFGTTLGEMFDFAQGHPVLLWKPVIEPDLGQERFLTEDPTKAFQAGRFMRIPIVAGITKDEFLVSAAYILRNDSLREELDENFERLAPICFLYERNTSKTDEITKELRRNYLGSGSLHKIRSLDGLGELFSDSLIGFAVHRFVRLAARFTRVFYYRFSYQGRYSFFLDPENKPYGVNHHDDLLYLLRMPQYAPLFTEEDPESKTVERMTRLWTNFASQGNPNNLRDKYLSKVRWLPFTFGNEPYLDIGDELIMRNRLYTERFALWKRLFPLNWGPRQGKHDINNCDYPEVNEDFEANENERN